MIWRQTTEEDPQMTRKLSYLSIASAALLAAGAPLTETSLGTRQPMKGMMRL
jgi:hypothetical protein